MLCISRNRGQRILIYDGIELVMTVTVNRAHMGQANIGIDAPKRFRIIREELLKPAAPPTAAPAS